MAPRYKIMGYNGDRRLETTMLTISPELALGLFLAILGAFAGLIKLVRYLDNKRVEEAIKKADEAAKAVADRVRDLEAKVQQAEIRAQGADKCQSYTEKGFEELKKTHGEDVKTIFIRLDSARETLADMRETLAGFGSNYVSRKEYLDDRNARKHA